uniref:Uncharacterized protein n=1 Tax=Arundo donax TaxID=35708 RepID=A0A0A9ELN2_ARUDO
MISSRGSYKPTVVTMSQVQEFCKTMHRLYTGVWKTRHYINYKRCCRIGEGKQKKSGSPKLRKPRYSIATKKELTRTDNFGI